LLSTSDVRYVGELHTVDPSEPSISLKNVQCLGTEERRSGQQAIAPSSTTYEFIRFRANNIKSLHLEKNNQKIDLSKEILEPLRQMSNSSNNQQETRQPGQQQASNKNIDKQRNKPTIVNDEPKRKVGMPQQPNYGAPYDYYSQRSPQYASTNPYEHGFDVYPPIPSPHQTGQDGVYTPDYPYGNDLTYSHGTNFSHIAPQSPYYYRETGHNAPILPNNEDYYQQSPINYSFTGPHPSTQTNISLTNKSYDHANYGNYRQYPVGNYDYYQQQPNVNRARYPNDRHQDQRGYHKGVGGMSGNQRQGPSSGVNRNRYVNRNNNQAPGTGAYLDRRLRGDDLNISSADFDFASSNVALETTDKKNDVNNDKTVQGEEKQKEEISDINNTTKNNSNETPSSGQEKNQIEDKNTKQKETSSTTNNEKQSITNETKSAYDKNKSFFDNITTDSDVKKQQKQVNLEEQRYNDAETFGTVAETYRSRHGVNQQNNDNNNKYRHNNNNNQRNFNQQRRNNYSIQQKYNNYRPRYNNNQFDANYFVQNNSNFDNINQQKWVQKRIN